MDAQRSGHEAGKMMRRPVFSVVCASLGVVFLASCDGKVVREDQCGRVTSGTGVSAFCDVPGDSTPTTRDDWPPTYPPNVYPPVCSTELFVTVQAGSRCGGDP